MCADQLEYTRARRVNAHTTAPAAVTDTLSFGATLKRYRRAAGLTQDELAVRAGYSVGHISKLESSVRLPVAATIELLADALALSPAERSALERAARRTGGLSPGSPWAQPQGLPPLLGRELEVAAIERHLTAAAEPPLLLLSGEPGIGKSRLLQVAAERGASEGWFVAAGACRRRGAQGPFGPLVEALLDIIRHMDQHQLRVALTGCSWLARLIPELAESGAAPMPTWSLSADQERRLMFSAVRQFLCAVAGPAGTLLLLDNAQWASADTLDLLGALIEAAPRSPLRVIGAYRQNEVVPASDLTALITDLAQEQLTIRRGIGALAPTAAAELLDTLLAGADHVGELMRAEALHNAAGVPFVLISYAQWLRSETSQEGGAELGIPQDVAQAVEQRIAALPEPTRVLARIASAVDGDAPRALLISVAQRLGLTEAASIAALDSACEVGVLVERDHDVYAFTYDLFQQVIERSIGAAQHAYLHQVIAEVMEGASTRPSAEALAQHYVRADEPEKALTYLERAGAHAEALHAYSDAAFYYRILAELERSIGRDRLLEASQARERLGVMLGYMGRFQEALAELDAALEGYRSGGRYDEQARVAAEIGQAYYARGEIEQGIARLEREATDLEGAPDSGGKLAALYLALAQLYGAHQQFEHALEAATRAVELARASNDRHLLAVAELERGTALGMLDRLDESLRVLEDEAAPQSEMTGDLWSQALALDHATQSRIQRGQFAEASADIERGMALAWQLDDQLVSGMMLLNRGMLRCYQGDWRHAQTDLRWASALLRPHRLMSCAAHASVWLGKISLAKGRRQRAEYELRRGLALAEASGAAPVTILAHCALAERSLFDGKPEEARLRLEPLLARGSGYRLSELTGVLALLGWAHLALGDVRQSESYIASSVLRAWDLGQQCALADALRVRAVAAAYQERWEDAWASITEAQSLAHTLPYPYAEAKALVISAQFLMRLHKFERARAQADAAHGILRRLGEQLYDARARYASGLPGAL